MQFSAKLIFLVLFGYFSLSAQIPKAPSILYDHGEISHEEIDAVLDYGLLGVRADANVKTRIHVELTPSKKELPADIFKQKAAFQMYFWNGSVGGNEIDFIFCAPAEKSRILVKLLNTKAEPACENFSFDAFEKEYLGQIYYSDSEEVRTIGCCLSDGWSMKAADSVISDLGKYASLSSKLRIRIEINLGFDEFEKNGKSICRYDKKSDFTKFKKQITTKLAESDFAADRVTFTMKTQKRGARFLKIWLLPRFV